MLMPLSRTRFGWLQSGLFWRTFFLLAFLITTSMATWVASISMIERTPRAQQLAAQIISIVTVTRAALTHSAPDLRRELLFDLASNEGIRIYPLEENDVIERLPNSPLLAELQANVKARLGQDTRFASSVNDVVGFWISFKIQDDEYWLRLDRERVEHVSSIQWLGWGTITLVLSLLGAVFISRLINQPLAQLTTAARAIGKGQQPAPLPEKGPTEIREANHSFNQMVHDLNQVEADRAIILAGISHDLRTPLARMQLEVELAKLSDDARTGMQSDLAQMDAIIDQFLDYARPSDANHFMPVGISGMLIDSARESSRLPDVKINSSITDNLEVLGNPTDLQRVVNNLIENARRYGKTPDKNVVELDISCRIDADQVTIQIADHGLGIPEQEMERLVRPFTRLDAARSQANGAGLGLAIVDRVIKRHGGQLRLSNRKPHGLAIDIVLPGNKRRLAERA
jgi:two-component system osmolarity sensor histidine kinase EnvZ